MSILLDRNNRVLCQGLGKAGLFHTIQCFQYGTRIVGGIKPGQGHTHLNLYDVKGQDFPLPLFDTVREAVSETQADTTMIFVPGPAAADAICEAAEAGISLVICITEGIPVHDMVKVKKYLKDKHVRLIGPNCPGIISPGEGKAGIMPGYIHQPGHIGVVSRSGTLTYEAVWQLTKLGLGQSTCVGIGGDPVAGSTFVDILKEFQDDPQTHAVVLIGEIGGGAEEQAGLYIRDHFTKPVVGYIAGRTARPGKRMGHAGAIVSGSGETALEKMQFLRSCGVRVVESPAEIGTAVKDILIKF